MNDPMQTMQAIRFSGNGRIPMSFHINSACWQHYPQGALFDLMESHTYLFPGFKRPQGVYRPAFNELSIKGQPYADSFGCTWETSEDGILGVVTKHPLADWAAFDTYQMPDPSVCMGLWPIDWAAEAQSIRAQKANGTPVVAALRHGHTFLQLCDLRGYENLMYDMSDEEPRLYRLIEQLEAFNMAIVEQYTSMNVDIMEYPDDMGMQFTPMLSPAHFRQYLQPSYKRLMRAARDKGIAVHMHSDGCIRDLIPAMLECGTDIQNLQDVVNGVEWIEENLKGRVCIELDIDRQTITPYGTPQQIDALIREEVLRLGSPKGGLMMIYGLYPGVPLANIKALMDAMEAYAFYWEDR